MEHIIEKICRERSKEIYFSEHGDKKATLWVCGDILLTSGKKAKCSECGQDCFYDTKLENLFDKNHKKVCLKCTYENHFDEMSALEQDIIKKTLDSREKIDE